MRFVSLLTALTVMLTLYLVVLERPALIAFAEGDRAALGRTALAELVRSAAGGENDGAAAAATVPEPEEDEEVAAPADTQSERVVPVVAIRSQAEEIDSAVILRGRTEAARQVEVRAETSGRVVSEPRSRGTRVEEGELLCELAPGTRAAALAEAEARLAAAEIDARAAERLSEGGFASEVRAAGARASLQGAEAAVAAAREEIARLTISAPFGGVLETDTAELGSLLQPGGLCATVLRLDPIRLVGFVPEMQVDQIEVGAPAGARLSSGRIVTGQVSFIARSADPATRTFRAEVSVPNPDLTIRDGQTVEIGIRATGTEAHLVPGSALTLDDAGRLGVRLVDSEERARFAPVQVVRDTTDGIWLSGLPPEADIIVVGQEFVIDGVAVHATFRDPPGRQGERSLRQMLEAATTGGTLEALQ